MDAALRSSWLSRLIYRFPLLFILGFAHGPIRRCCGDMFNASSWSVLLLFVSLLLRALDPIDALMSAPITAMLLLGISLYNSATCWLKKIVSSSVYPECGR